MIYPSPSQHTRDLPLEYYVMLPHVSEASVLLVRDGNGWPLPHFTPHVTDFRLVQHIHEYVREQYGIATVVQRCVCHRSDANNGQPYRVYALENRSSVSHPPAGGRWVDGDELDRVQLAIPQHREIMRRWLHEAATGAGPALRAPWAQKGWFDEAQELAVEYVLNKVGCKGLVTAASFKTSDYVGMLRQLAPELDTCKPGDLHAATLPGLRTVICIDQASPPGMFRFADVPGMAGDAERGRRSD